MLQFNKLRLTGFKSFVENTELHINLGLTGVVGPNGCGKSNLVEALQWVMGETSAKQMRGSGMDDLIFGGTASRPQRNLAEVVLALDNSERTAPALFNDTDEIDVSRKIDRDKGSTYRINGKEVRARDVQLLFADSSTGARSTALVSQGRIGSVVNAKPQQRRSLLEEAAGITGLHSRRHEAELRLNGAKTNLERLDDILITLDTQFASLKKQSRQANRYTNLSDHIRKAEATLFHIRWLDANAMQAEAEETLRVTQVKVGELTALASQAATEQASKAETLPALRLAEAQAAAELHRINVARDNLSVEEERLLNAVSETQQGLEQIGMDLLSAETFATDAKESIERLVAEQEELEAAQEEELSEYNKATEALTQADLAAEEAEAKLNTANALVADIEAQSNGLSQRISEIEESLEQTSLRASELQNQLDELEINRPESSNLDEAECTLTVCFKAVDMAQRKLESAEQERSKAESTLQSATKALQEANAELTRLTAEEKAISDFLDIAGNDVWPPLIDAVNVKPGYEAALGAALGEDLNVPVDEAAPIHWRTLIPLTKYTPLPAGAIPMSDLVKGPPALARRLAQIGVVETDQQGKVLASSLSQGQRLVSCEGGLWRWDGYTVSSQATTSAAARLEQRNRLVEVRSLLNLARNTVSKAKEIRDAAEEAEQSSRMNENLAREELRKTDQELNAARETLATEKEKASVHETRMGVLNEALGTVLDNQNKIGKNLRTQQIERQNLPNLEKEQNTLVLLRTRLAEFRGHQVELKSRHNQLERIANERTNRLEIITTELETWNRRNADSTRQLEILAKRKEALSNHLADLKLKPVDLEAQRKKLMDCMLGSEAQRNEAADALAEAETTLSKADQNLREAESTLVQAREHNVRNESAVEQAKQICIGLSERIYDRLGCGPEDLFEISGLDPISPLPEVGASERKVERLIRERETMGPVNLRAQQEAEELTTQIESLIGERDDLLKAIEKLRHGISELNREGRARLLASFEEVDKHFQELFTRLFGGGTAHLALTDSDDPLEAGLEIMASPPGKKLQILSLLSGGEQALTALALLFGVFLTNPAPICVLDEVDAPLDDANVDRFCTMLEEMAKKEKTRFLIITHHRMTMARMDRLFGVTMQERGVSQLVSVDLQKAEKLRDIA